MKQAKELLDRGYAKLTAFEVPEASKREGFEWFGQSPAHEALTAYGLMQFRDMARVTDVDPQCSSAPATTCSPAATARAASPATRCALDTFGRAPADVTNAYIVWALTESGKDDDVTKELNVLAEQAKTADDPYFLALVANGLLNRDRADEAAAILHKLAGKLTKDGFLDGAKTSITGSVGPDAPDRDDGPGRAGLAQGQPAGRVHAGRAVGGHLDRQAARRLRRLRLDAIDDPGPQGA